MPNNRRRKQEALWIRKKGANQQKSQREGVPTSNSGTHRAGSMGQRKRLPTCRRRRYQLGVAVQRLLQLE